MTDFTEVKRGEKYVVEQERSFGQWEEIMLPVKRASAMKELEHVRAEYREFKYRLVRITRKLEEKREVIE